MSPAPGSVPLIRGPRLAYGHAYITGSAAEWRCVLCDHPVVLTAENNARCDAGELVAVCTSCLRVDPDGRLRAHPTP